MDITQPPEPENPPKTISPSEALTIPEADVTDVTHVVKLVEIRFPFLSTIGLHHVDGKTDACGLIGVKAVVGSHACFVLGDVTHVVDLVEIPYQDLRDLRQGGKAQRLLRRDQHVIQDDQGVSLATKETTDAGSAWPALLHPSAIPNIKEAP
ncbi:hypothetical protein E4U53_001423 [Claviceps sorghi]|nr:hypothetical protein E4U53_001423 [Claviceps sorghi]